MSEISSLFTTAFESIDNDFDADDFAKMSDLDCALKNLKSGEIGRLSTHAGRRMIAMGTPLGLILIGEQYPRDSTRIKLTVPPGFAALFPNPMEDYLTPEAFQFYYGSDLMGPNIGQRLEDVLGVMIHRSTHNPVTGAPLNVAMDTPD